jgi:DNA polymerase
VQLKYHGAHTGRLSGGGSINTQNLNRGSKLRKSIIAPPGKVIVVADLSQIELRVNMTFSGQSDVVRKLANGEDVYKEVAAFVFNRPLEAISKDSVEQFVGKVLSLACGYGMGHRKFRVTCAQGPMGAAPIYFSEDEARDIIAKYRMQHQMVKANWDWLGTHGVRAMMLDDVTLDRGPVAFTRERILLPNGLSLIYPNIGYNEDGDTVWGLDLENMHKIYGGLIAENVVQALAGIILKEMMLRIDSELRANVDGHVVHQVHDEILAVCPEQDADDVLAMMLDQMSAPPTWMPDVPVTAEGGYAREYSK